MCSVMSVLYYFEGRGRAEVIRWMLAACDVQYDEVFIKTREQLDKLIFDGKCLFKQVPVLAIDGINICQTQAILRYLARKYNLYGKNEKDAAIVDMFVESINEVSMPLIGIPFMFDQKHNVLEKYKTQVHKIHFPVYEKLLTKEKQSLLDGEELTLADVLLTESILLALEYDNTILNGFPSIKNWLDRQVKIPWIAKFMQPGSQRKPPPGPDYVATVKAVCYPDLK